FNHGNVVAQQLQRQGVEHRRDDVVAGRHRQHDHVGLRLNGGGFAGKYEQLTATGAHFFNVGFQFFHQNVVRRHHHDGHFGVDQRQRAVFQLAGGVGFSVDVGNFFQFQRPFHGDGVLVATAEEQGVVFFGKAFGQLLNIG